MKYNFLKKSFRVSLSLSMPSHSYFFFFFLLRVSSSSVFDQVVRKITRNLADGEPYTNEIRSFFDRDTQLALIEYTLLATRSELESFVGHGPLILANFKSRVFIFVRYINFVREYFNLLRVLRNLENPPNSFLLVLSEIHSLLRNITCKIQPDFESLPTKTYLEVTRMLQLCYESYEIQATDSQEMANSNAYRFQGNEFYDSVISNMSFILNSVTPEL
jgi:hypothetical protein